MRIAATAFSPTRDTRAQKLAKCCSARRRPAFCPVLSSEKRLRLSLVGMDGFGIVYLIENAQEFWSGALWTCCHLTLPLLTLKTELEDILKIPGNASLTLLDATLKRSLTFCASYHGVCWTTAGPLSCAHAWHLQNNIYRVLYNSNTHAT